MKITFAIALLAAAVFKESQQQSCFQPFEGHQPSRSGHADLYSGQQEFSLNLLNAINKVLPNENLFFSPYSTYHALLMAYFLSGKQTEQYLKKVLRLNPTQEKSDIYAAYKTDKLLTQILSRDLPYEFNSANKFYVEQKVPVKECIFYDFPQELERKDFATSPEAARVSINNWVENITHHMIKDLLPPGTIDAQTDLVLVNAAYFKGLWENKFPPEATKPDVFYVSPTKQITVQMMHVEGTFKHDVSETLRAHILEMPYQGGNISMYIILPPWSNTENSIEATLKKLTLENFKSIVDNEHLIPKTVQVAFPKFSLETTLEMTPILDFLGVGNLFTSNADFSELTSKKVSLGEGVHKARIEINEQGSQAAAATSFFTFRMMGDEDDIVNVTCNKPFIYFIYNRKAKTVLFSGLLKSPPSNQ
ncbi:unnamed protein product [Phyllotreta striolata]|uniref:Serpin domain-containing protein n=1 Tax=Phyllotreta striolata TaxID=444603 RepID=A0A9N9TGZ2_PHYSR|nr:unnamed protein product [Phyllotreta striolata]